MGISQLKDLKRGWRWGCGGVTRARRENSGGERTSGRGGRWEGWEALPYGTLNSGRQCPLVVTREALN